MWENVIANLSANAATNSAFWLAAFLVGWCAWGWLMRRKSQTMRAESEKLLKDANDAVHELLNRAALRPVDQVERAFDKWEFDMAKKLERLRREGVCTAWKVDYFQVLNRFALVEESKLKGMISEKANRLKDIARQLEEQAARLWPL